MTNASKQQQKPGVPCFACGKKTTPAASRPWIMVRPRLSDLISAEAPGWGDGAVICVDCLSRFRRSYVEKLLTDEKGELAELDKQVMESLATGEPVSQDPSEMIDEASTYGDRMADRLAIVGGSWGFILSFSTVLVVWIMVNSAGLLIGPFDPYPFILLNLVLSSLAALQAPVIMMSQRRQEMKDRLRAENDYRVNLKAELEIRQLHEKLDHQLARQWEKLAELQQIQIELLEERTDAKRR